MVRVGYGEGIWSEEGWGVGDEHPDFIEEENWGV